MRSHRGIADVNPADLFLQIEVGDEFLYQQEHLIMGLSFALAKSVRADRNLNDRDLIAAASSLAKSYETLVNSGLHYETPITNSAQLMAAAELQNMLKEFREAQQKHIGYVQLRDSEILRALVFIVRMTYGRTSGRPKSRAFVDFLLAQFPEKPEGIAAPETAGSIVIP